MVGVQNLVPPPPPPSLSFAAAAGATEEFPAGLRVLVVDDDVTCLRILEHMLQRCRYHVTSCQATVALSLLRENKGGYDVVISDVHMPDMDGFRLLELVGLEMDLPVIMMSADGRTSAVMRGIKHGACDYLIKPVRIEELKNIWQHVIRKKWNENKELEHSGSLVDSDRLQRVADDADYASSVVDVSDGTWRSQKKRRDSRDDEDLGELDNDDPSSSKRPRVVWSVELHQQFVSAVNQLGIDNAVPKRILELMNVPGLTRENVASHLQKFRLYLKRLSLVAQQHSGFSNSFCGLVEPTAKAGSLGGLDFQTLVASGQIPPQTLAALHAELLGRPSGGLVLPAIDSALIQASVPKCIPFVPGVAFGQPLLKFQSSISKQATQANISAENFSGFSAWHSGHAGIMGSAGGINNHQNGGMAPQMLQQQEQLPVSEYHHAIIVQPSCMVVPSQASNILQVESNPVSLNPNAAAISSQDSQPSSMIQLDINPVTLKQSSNYNIYCSAKDYIPLSSLSADLPLDKREAADEGFKNCVPKGYIVSASLASAILPSSMRTDSTNSWQMHRSSMSGTANLLPGHLPNLHFLCSEPDTAALPDQGHKRNLGFVGKGTRIPSRFAVDDIESPTSGINNTKTCLNNDGSRVKQEIQLDFMDDSV